MTTLNPGADWDLHINEKCLGYTHALALIYNLDMGPSGISVVELEARFYGRGKESREYLLATEQALRQALSEVQKKLSCFTDSDPEE